MEVQDLLEAGQVRSKGHQFTQVQDRAAEKDSSTGRWDPNQGQQEIRINKQVRKKQEHQGDQDQQSHLYEGQGGVAWLRCSAAVRALQCHFLAGSVTAEQPLMFCCSSSSNCRWEPP